MNILNVGPLEFLLVILVALVVLGPQDIVNYSRRFGKWIYHVAQSPVWRSMVSTSQELRDLPQKIIREAGMEESLAELNKLSAGISKSTANSFFSLSAEPQTSLKKDGGTDPGEPAETGAEGEKPIP
jgi:Sec-independent protein translocase protein TatA